MLLIFANLIRQSWVLIYASSSIEGNDTETYSGLCDASGFFHQFGTEAADFAVLIIAIHAALCIFRKGAPYAGEGGIYRYRYPVYFLWATFAILGSALAFINPGYGYISIPPFCYLPIEPLWYRLALSWVPRYTILLIIIIIYIAVNIYVRKKFKSFSLKHPAEYSGGSEASQSTNEANEAPSMDETDSRPESGSKAHEEVLSEGGQNGPGISEADSTNMQSTESSMEREEACKRKKWPFQNPFPANSVNQESRRRNSAPDTHGFELGVLKRQAFAVRQGSTGPSSVQPQAPRASDLGSNISEGLGALTHPPKTYMRKHSKAFSSKGTASRPESVRSCPAIKTNGTTSQNENAAERNMRRMRRNIRRQLRLLFVYPIVYVVMWILPFVGSILQLSNYYVSHPEFVFSCFLVVSLLIQGAVDCLIFNWREKPWRHIPNSDGTFLGSFLFWKTFSVDDGYDNSSGNSPRRSDTASGAAVRRVARHSGESGFWNTHHASLRLPTYYDDGVGLSVAEMEAQAKTAYARRDRERVEYEKQKKKQQQKQETKWATGGDQLGEQHSRPANQDDNAEKIDRKDSLTGSAAARSDKEQREWWNGIPEEDDLKRNSAFGRRARGKNFSVFSTQGFRSS
ncbi:hypothetical protein L228DRAFT_281937 [Xylona heveae TC161]|uniref:G protein-coupled receptor GPR1 C-terminal domain-containing protein n=1 Tax=Xylona heveae (strain CBS 132557 / TC161) TaxID=1328760 RepID=A0A165H9W7_XYLHT|nr:hypothetical protein L228DRAFT_281937 [Xylona heveae TC161]KZF23190.1 hypothetical protein L228DRAFT_281937 [Xylona heveae TC161]